MTEIKKAMLQLDVDVKEESAYLAAACYHLYLVKRNHMQVDGSCSVTANAVMKEVPLCKFHRYQSTGSTASC